MTKLFRRILSHSHAHAYTHTRVLRMTRFRPPSHSISVHSHTHRAASVRRTLTYLLLLPPLCAGNFVTSFRHTGGDKHRTPCTGILDEKFSLSAVFSIRGVYACTALFCLVLYDDDDDLLSPPCMCERDICYRVYTWLSNGETAVYVVRDGKGSGGRRVIRI